jgi:hypothetical protein
VSAAAFFDAARALKRELTETGAGLTQPEVDALNAVIATWTAQAAQPTGKVMAWGAKVSPTFRERVQWVADQLGVSASDLMACIAWESGRSFSPAVRNKAGSGATGLIQFMPATAQALGTSADALARMTAEDQLNYVYKYFEPHIGKLKTLSDLYMAILWPAAVGKPDDYELWNTATRPTTFRQNAGLDANHNGSIVKAEVAGKLYAMRAEGLRPENAA